MSAIELPPDAGAVPQAHDPRAPYRVCDMPVRMRPREAVERLGVENVPDQVLLAILLRSGARGMNVVDLAERLVRTYGSLTALSRASVEELTGNRHLRGLGKVKAQMLKAALELSRRMADERRDERGSVVRSPEDAAVVLRETAKPLDHERFWTLPLDSKNRLKWGVEEISRGILDTSLVHPREVFKRAIQWGCAAVVLVHNHPSGDPTPSAEDVRITRQLIQAGQVIGIKVLDHIVLGRPSAERARDFVSLRESGTVEFVD
jgi:DNA repair protein RadC